jgi:hypothetical protein
MTSASSGAVLVRIPLCISIVCLSLSFQNSFAQEVSESDIDPILGDRWNGHLTYIDYGSGKETKIPVNLTVTEGKKKGYQLAFSYPEEPHANSTETLSIRDDGRKINNRRVLSKDTTKGGSTVIVCTTRGRDNNEKATLRFTYSFSNKQFSIRKEVQYEGKTDWFLRNIFVFER